MLRIISKWRDAFLILLLVLFDISIHALGAGPDRHIHDPAVYRLWDSAYLSSDWYTTMAVKSGVYIFYAKLVNAWHWIGIHEELWRVFLYVVSLLVLYYALVKIGRYFSRIALVIPIVAVLHMIINTGNNQPIWLYGPFMHVDGGLAPRSIGIALSFLALFFLLDGSLALPAILLGVATLIHVSNSLIVFTLFFLVWLVKRLLSLRSPQKQDWFELIQLVLQGVLLYLLFGGWYALYAAAQGVGAAPDFAVDKFVWAWIYLRAPYMALPLVGKYWWIRLAAHGLAIMVGWALLRPRLAVAAQDGLDRLALLGLGALVYFFVFYLFAFVHPWLPGFQFYSIRVVYFTYFVAYLFISLCFLLVGREIATKVLGWVRLPTRLAIPLTVLAIIIVLALFGLRLKGTFAAPSLAQLQTSWLWLTQNENQRKPLNYPTFTYLASHPEPFLAPPNWRTGTIYLPNVASYKSFGFTPEGLPEWFDRMNEVSGGEIERAYVLQQQSGHFRPIEPVWPEWYRDLSSEKITALSQKYNFHLFLTYQDTPYPFETVTEDNDYHLYRLP